jgi:hypothetical protein
VPGGGQQDYNNQGGYRGGNQKPNPPFPHPAYGDPREQYRPSPYGEPPQPRQQQHAHAPHAAINGYGPSPRSHAGSPPHPPSSPGFQHQVRINGVIQGVQEHLTGRQGIPVMAQRRPRNGWCIVSGIFRRRLGMKQVSLSAFLEWLPGGIPFPFEDVVPLRTYTSSMALCSIC